MGRRVSVRQQPSEEQEQERGARNVSEWHARNQPFMASTAVALRAAFRRSDVLPYGRGPQGLQAFTEEEKPHTVKFGRSKQKKSPSNNISPTCSRHPSHPHRASKNSWGCDLCRRTMHRAGKPSWIRDLAWRCRSSTGGSGGDVQRAIDQLQAAKARQMPPPFNFGASPVGASTSTSTSVAPPGVEQLLLYRRAGDFILWATPALQAWLRLARSWTISRATASTLSRRPSKQFITMTRRGCTARWLSSGKASGKRR